MALCMTHWLSLVPFIKLHSGHMCASAADSIRPTPSLLITSPHRTHNTPALISTAHGPHPARRTPTFVIFMYPSCIIRPLSVLSISGSFFLLHYFIMIPPYSVAQYRTFHSQSTLSSRSVSDSSTNTVHLPLAAQDAHALFFLPLIQKISNELGDTYTVYGCVDRPYLHFVCRRHSFNFTLRFL
ncbi:hypothetical protein BDZ97DRAFT_26767 [Flammula alnicola]|nr:hypothetical protein BDZ97DRAFT_26767 [Flammula alnicola]